MAMVFVPTLAPQGYAQTQLGGLQVVQAPQPVQLVAACGVPQCQHAQPLQPMVIFSQFATPGWPGGMVATSSAGLPMPFYQPCAVVPTVTAAVSPAASADTPAAPAEAAVPDGKAPKATQQYSGTVKSFNTSTGFGFIECEELMSLYGKDVFVHRKEARGLRPGDYVVFEASVDETGPRVQNLIHRRQAHRTPRAAAPFPAGSTSRF
eukprot:TRINITY_DN104_c1_g1_i1.p1 TRINITY_DN104_c1_g1~~TRINITY_DN104_c1_g1_i1.p1  ORF type:complete len:236 (+),score=29.22 TRINITY_DN104_c1_g1_i1:90-710(+)